MRIVVLFLVFISIFSCKTKDDFVPRDFTKVEIEIILEDSLLNVRAIEIVKDIDGAFFATSNGKFGIINENSSPVTYSIPVSDSLTPNFRAVAITSKFGFGLSIGSPALLFKMKNDLKEIVYREDHPKAFYDSMNFWNDEEGIAIGDSIDGCLSVIITRDGGNTWTKLSCHNLPEAKENEGAFAASDTNIAIVGDETWVATTSGRVYYSKDKGLSWEVTQTPITKDKETEGIYSIGFYDELNGFAIGGDYTKPEGNQANKIRTQDGGKTWQVVAKGENPGYRSCVQYIPNREGKELVAIGFKGIDYSNDSGNSWKHLSDEGFYTIRFLNDSVAYAAGKERISKLTFSE